MIEYNLQKYMFEVSGKCLRVKRRSKKKVRTENCAVKELHSGFLRISILWLVIL